MCFEYERLEQLRKEMEQELKRNRELKEKARTSAPPKTAPEKTPGERQPVPA